MTAPVEASFEVQLTHVGASYEARDSTGHGVRLDGLPLEPRWSTILVPLPHWQVKQLAPHLFEKVKLTIRIETIEEGR